VTDETRRRTLTRHARRDQQYTAGGRKRSSLETPLGRKSLRIFLKPVADAIRKRLDKTPANLIEVVGRLDSYELAGITLAPIIDGIMWGFGDDDWKSKRALYYSVGRYLKYRLEFAKTIELADVKPSKRGRPRTEDFTLEEWRPRECVLAGWWLVERAVESKYFEFRGHKIVVALKHGRQFKRMRQALLYAEPYFMPHLSPPADWTGWRKHYDRRISATFIRSWRTDQRPAIEDLFKGSFPHAEAINHRKNVALRVNQDMLAIVERYALKILNAKISRSDRQRSYKRSANKLLVAADLEDAKWIGDRTFWLDYACDERGRMYALQRFSFDREDHIRSLIEFNYGIRCGEQGFQWLEINCATLYGIDKVNWAERLQWTGANRQLIREIAQDPIGTFKKWRDADKPFQFVRSCIELCDADDNPEHITHLAVGMDATCSGLQHLSLLCRDYQTMERVNLTLLHNKVLDIYDDIAAHVTEKLKADNHPWAPWWLDRLGELGNKRRRLFKQPVQTYSYASTKENWNEQIREAYAELLQQGRLSIPLPRTPGGSLVKRRGKSSVGYLVNLVGQSCKECLPGPTAVMHWLQDRVARMYERFMIVSWDSPSEFPCRVMEEPPDTRRVKGVRVADGTKPVLDLKEMKKDISANFVHSMDAAHAVLTINSAVRLGITNILCTHDCFYSYAPRMWELQRNAVLATLRDMYQQHDPLHELWLRNGADGDPPPRFLDDKTFFALLDQLPGCDYSFS
jgi:DNA-directed RNA polymerase